MHLKCDVCNIPYKIIGKQETERQVATLVCLIHEQGLISAQGGIYQKINKRTGPNNCTGWKNFRDLKIAAQGLIIAQGKNNYKE